MAEASWLWTTSDPPLGDGKVSYTQADWADIVRVLGACNGWEGVAAGYLNSMSSAAAGANTVNVNTGGALVDGRPYQNTAVVAVNIPSAVGAGNTRIDRIVLRADWTAQTVRITRLAGTDAASPTPPSLTQISGTTYDVLLCQVLVNTSGAVVVTDERTYGQSDTDGLLDGAVTEDKLAAAVALQLVANGDSHNHVGGDGAEIPEAALAAAAAAKLVTGGNAHGHTGGAGAAITEAALAAAVAAKLVTNGNGHDHVGGDGAAIAEAALAAAVAAKLVTNGNGHDHVGGDGAAIAEAALAAAVAAKLVTNGNSHDHVGGDGAAIPAGGLANGAVDATARLANDIVDDSKIGYRVPAIPWRYGGGSSWPTAGTTGYPVDNVRMQCGVATVTIAAGQNKGTRAVTLAQAFGALPIVLASLQATYGAEDIVMWSAYGGSGASITLEAYRTGTTGDATVTMAWLAVGPE